MRELLTALSPLGRTAWNDACCRAAYPEVCQDAMASWIVEAFGHSPAFVGLDPLVSVGAAARRRVFDRLITDVWKYLGPMAAGCEIWLLGAGFDTHRDFGPNARKVLAFDLPEVLEVRASMSDLAQLPARSQLEVALPTDFREANASFPKTDWPILAIAEGLFDYLDTPSRSRLLRSLAKSSRKVVLLCDGLDHWGSALDNRRPQRFTGDAHLSFVGAPRDAVAFHRACGWETAPTCPCFAKWHC